MNQEQETASFLKSIEFGKFGVQFFEKHLQEALKTVETRPEFSHLYSVNLALSDLESQVLSLNILYDQFKKECAYVINESEQVFMATRDAGKLRKGDLFTNENLLQSTLDIPIDRWLDLGIIVISSQEATTKAKELASREWVPPYETLPPEKIKEALEALNE